jgi:hypothetical protein
VTRRRCQTLRRDRLVGRDRREVDDSGFADRGLEGMSLVVFPSAKKWRGLSMWVKPCTGQPSQVTWNRSPCAWEFFRRRSTGQRKWSSIGIDRSMMRGMAAPLSSPAS